MPAAGGGQLRGWPGREAALGRRVDCLAVPPSHESRTGRLTEVPRVAGARRRARRASERACGRRRGRRLSGTRPGPSALRPWQAHARTHGPSTRAPESPPMARGRRPSSTCCRPSSTAAAPCQRCSAAGVGRLRPLGGRRACDSTLFRPARRNCARQRRRRAALATPAGMPPRAAVLKCAGRRASRQLSRAETGT